MTEGKYEASGPGLEKASFKIKVNEDFVPFTIERPDMLHGANNYATEAVILAPGWTETEEALKPLRAQLAMRGLAAVTIYHPRVMRPDKVLKGAQLRVDNITALAHFLINEYYGVHFVGHSFGGTDITKSVYERNAPVKSLNLHSSGGMVKSDNFEDVARRVINKIIKEEPLVLLRSPFSELAFALESIGSVIRNPGLAAVEGIAAATHYVGRHIDEIYDRGIVTTNSMADGDFIFPHEKVIESTKGMLFDEVRLYKDSCHNFTSHRPKEVADYMAKILLNTESILANRPHKIAA
jgi:hypothetical protein